MKIKLLSTLLLSSCLLSSSIFAYTIVSKHNECHGNAGGECQILNEHITSSLDGDFKKREMIPYSVHSTAEIKNQFGFDSQTLTVRAHHQVHMRNGDDHKKRYHYMFEIECEKMVNKYDYDVDLEGHEEFTTSADSSIDVRLKAASYKIAATTDISNAEQDRQGRGAYLYIR